MGFKSILTVATDQTALAPLLGSAVAMATREDAHLDVLCLGLDRTQVGYYYGGGAALVYQETVERAQEDSVRVEAEAKAILDGQTLRWSTEAEIAQIGSIVNPVGMRARFSDLVILPRPYGEGRGPEDEAIVEAALFDGRVPVLVVPDAGIGPDLGRRIVLAWNQSDEALTAARQALPFLIRAESVNIAIIDPPPHGPERSDPGGALSQLLTRHGVRTEVSVLARTTPRISDTLTRHAMDQDADLIVMGAYGHSRFREAILGGATRHMLEQSEIAMLLAH
ncbi:nucleotide-binding universal stress UspA family protein [Rhodobacteraceae bacterium MBR-64]|jgi:nucleotide-binding universal stress UspA family protein